MQFSYTLTGTIHVPDGTTLTDTGSSLRLTDGRVVQLWEALEIHTEGADDHRDLTSIEAETLGLFYDGDMCAFEAV